MSEVIEGFKLMRQAGRKRRAENLASNMKRLQDEGITYLSYNDGYHLVLNINGKRISFWPSSGKWVSSTYIIKRPIIKGSSVDSLLAYIKSLNNV